MMAMLQTGQMTTELRDYLEIAYVSLADYVDDDSARLLREFARAGEALAADARRPRDKATSLAWRRITDQSPLAGAIARAISTDADQLREEYRSWLLDVTVDVAQVE